MFYIRQVGEGADKKFYLNLRNSESLDFENPLDKDGNNIYNLTLQIQVQGNGLQPVASFIDMVLVVNDIDDDPLLHFLLGGMMMQIITGVMPKMKFL